MPFLIMNKLESAMGKIRKGKQNNLRVNDIMRNAVTWDYISEEISRFIKS